MRDLTEVARAVAKARRAVALVPGALNPVYLHHGLAAAARLLDRGMSVDAVGEELPRIEAIESMACHNARAHVGAARIAMICISEALLCAVDAAERKYQHARNRAERALVELDRIDVPRAGGA